MWPVLGAPNGPLSDFMSDRYFNVGPTTAHFQTSSLALKLSVPEPAHHPLLLSKVPYDSPGQDP